MLPYFRRYMCQADAQRGAAVAVASERTLFCRLACMPWAFHVDADPHLPPRKRFCSHPPLCSPAAVEWAPQPAAQEVTAVFRVTAPMAAHQLCMRKMFAHCTSLTCRMFAGRSPELASCSSHHPVAAEVRAVAAEQVMPMRPNLRAPIATCWTASQRHRTVQGQIKVS